MTFSSPCSGDDEPLGVRARLDRKHVDRGAAQVAVAQRLGQRVEIDHRAAAVVDEDRRPASSRAISVAPDHARASPASPARAG